MEKSKSKIQKKKKNKRRKNGGLKGYLPRRLEHFLFEKCYKKSCSNRGQKKQILRTRVKKEREKEKNKKQKPCRSHSALQASSLSLGFVARNNFCALSVRRPRAQYCAEQTGFSLRGVAKSECATLPHSRNRCLSVVQRVRTSRLRRAPNGALGPVGIRKTGAVVSKCRHGRQPLLSGHTDSTSESKPAHWEWDIDMAGGYCTSASEPLPLHPTDDDEWTRSLTEAQEITTDVPEDSVVHDQQEVDPERVQPIQMGQFLRKYVSRRLLAPSEGEIAALTTSLRHIGVGTQVGAEGPGHLSPALFRRVGRRFTQRTAGQNQGRRKEWLWNDRVEGSARGGVAVPSQAHGSSSVETPKPVSC